MMCFVRKLKFVGCAALIVSVLGLVVEKLWNWLLPGLFGLPAVTFLQAVGLMILSKILFGGFHRGMHMHGRRQWMERWEKMTPEEREKFHAGLSQRCWIFGSSEPDEKPEKKG